MFCVFKQIWILFIFNILFNFFSSLCLQVKHLLTNCGSLNGGLSKLASQLQLERIGTEHQAGSDAILTASIFFKIRSQYFNDTINHEKYSGILYGLNSDVVENIKKSKLLVEQEEEEEEQETVDK